MKNKLVLLAIAWGIIMMIGFVLLGGISGGGSDPAPIPVEEKYCYNYQYTAYKLGVDWEMALIIDLFNAQEYKRTDLKDENYLITTLNFVKLREDVYRQEIEYDEGSDLTITRYVYEETNYYVGAAEILTHLGVSDTERDVEVLIAALDGMQSQEHRYTLEREMDNRLVLDTYYSYLTDFQKETLMELYDSHYYVAVYGNQFTVAGTDVFLEDMTFAPNGMSIPLYKQYDPQWSTIRFGGGTISSSGCSVTSMGMVFTYLLGETVTPATIVDWTGNRYYVEPAGQSWGIFPACAAQWGLTCQNLGKDATAIVNALSDGKPVIASMAPGTFTKAGHFIVLRGITEDGKILVNDPNDNASKNFINRQFELSLILREAKNFWSFTN